MKLIINNFLGFHPQSPEFRAYSSLPHGFDANSSAFLRSLNEKKKTIDEQHCENDEPLVENVDLEISNEVLDSESHKDKDVVNKETNKQDKEQNQKKGKGNNKCNKSKSSKRSARRKRFNSLSPTRLENVKKNVQARKKGKRFTSLSDPNKEIQNDEIPEALKIGGKDDVDNMPEWAKVILKSNKDPDFIDSSSDEMKKLKVKTNEEHHKVFYESDENFSEVESAADKRIKNFMKKNLVNSESDDSCVEERVKTFRKRCGIGEDVDSDQSNLNFAAESMEDLPFSAMDVLDEDGVKKVGVRNAERIAGMLIYTLFET